MKNTLFTVVLFTVVLAGGGFAAPTTRYWDACKPSCGWNGNAGSSPNGICTSCDVNGNKLSGEGGSNACQNGPAYTCMGQAPWAVDDNLSYGFAAAHSNGDCGKCYELTFTSNGEGGTTGGSLIGKKMIIMVSNIGDIRAGAAFDLMIPGGGVGDFDALTRQINQLGGSSSNMGAQYGGFRADYGGGCGNNATCVRSRCDAAFGTSAMSHMKEGCYWFIDWFKNANNPTADHREVSCPAALVSVYKGNSWRPSGGGNPIVVPPTANYTVQVSRTPTAGGTVSVKIGTGAAQTDPSGQLTASANTSIVLTATPSANYRFVNWTAVSGSLPSGFSATSANVTFSINSNVNIRANFEATTTQPTTYSLQVTRNPTAGGSVAVTVGGTTQNNPQNSQFLTANTSVRVVATAATGYTFQNWTAVTGSLPSGFNATSASVTFNMPSAAVNIRANFTANGGNPPGGEPGGGNTYTLTTGVSPANSGTTSPASLSNIPAGQAVSITATPNNGYVFVNWTATGGSATFANANSASTTVTLKALAKRAATAAQYAEATITANFQSNGTNPPVNKTDTIRVEAEDYASKNGANMVTSTANGITNIGYIESGYSVTYTNVGVAQAGARTMVFRIASNYDQGQSSFKVSVNGTEVGTISGHTNDWDGYTNVTLSPDVQFNAGANTITLNFQTPVNVDYFLLIGEAAQPVSVRYNAVNKQTKPRAAVTLTASPRGFTAALPANHGYTAYKLVDLQGREVRSGKIGDGMSSLKFNNLKSSVLLLRLEGRNTSTVVKAVTY